MDPIFEGFPACCTAILLSQFGESEVAEGGNEKQDAVFLEYNIALSIPLYKRAGYAMLCATTNNEQKVTNKVLEKLNFKHSKWMSKDMHPETKIRLWWYPLN